MPGRREGTDQSPVSNTTRSEEHPKHQPHQIVAPGSVFAQKPLSFVGQNIPPLRENQFAKQRVEDPYVAWCWNSNPTGWTKPWVMRKKGM